MTPLRQKMLDAMVVRGFSERTQQSYLDAVIKLAQYYHRSPDHLSTDDIQAYFLYLVKERQLSPASCRLHLNGLRFFYLHVLHRGDTELTVHVPKRQQRIPELLTREEVAKVLSAEPREKQRMALTVCYGCGLRVSELAALRVTDIDGERRLLHVVKGKGNKDRNVILGEALLEQLRHYWLRYRPCQWLFYSVHAAQAYNITSLQRFFQTAKRRAGIGKVGGIHSLRHAYATHQLAAGMPLHILKQQLGHQDIHSTLRYVHWVPDYREGDGADLIADLEAHHD